MYKLHTIIFCLVTLLASTGYGQNAHHPDTQVDYGDSAVYFLSKSLNTHPVDSALFMKGLEYVSQMDLRSVEAIAEIEVIASAFRDERAFWYYNELKNQMVFNLTSSDSLDLAINFCKNIIDEYNTTRDPNIRLSAMHALIQIRIPLRTKAITNSLDYYTERLNAYLPLQDSTALAICYFGLGTTYRLTGLTDLCIYHIKKSRSYINQSDTLTTEPISGLSGWMNHTSVLAQLYLEIGDYPAALRYANEAKWIRLNQIKEPNVSFLNGNIALTKMRMNDLDSVYDLLDTAYLLAMNYRDYPSLVRILELKGMYFIRIGQLDSAETNLKKEKQAMESYNVNNFNPAGFLTPNYHLAHIRISQSRYVDAQKLLEEEIPKLMSIRSEKLKELKLLTEVHLKLGNTAAADSVFREYIELEQFIRDEERKNRNISFEIESRIADAESTISALETEKRIADLTKKYLIGIACLLLLVAMLIYNRFRVTSRQKVIIEAEKKKSDDLLLNILPAEVADELKAKGMADPKLFEHVSVMFTDISGFTQISERLSAAELVAEIDHCFKAFDHIITRYGIEKIKTIGDAYMCVSGLPISNTTHAIDIVSAAIDIQAFMQEYAQLRRSQGKEVFEIRIGIHSGQVVAGIVGLKKFAYDIWGDTVNIASRMESSGEAGKINISGTTFALIQHAFKCTYRGKVQAKNKGEVDMYFVDGYMPK